MIINLFFITFIITFIIDYSGIIQSIENFLYKKIGKSKFIVRIPKPFSCSLCMTFWTGLLYLIIIGCLNIQNIFIVCLFSISTKMIIDLIYLIIDFFDFILKKINGWIK